MGISECCARVRCLNVYRVHYLIFSISFPFPNTHDTHTRTDRTVITRRPSHALNNGIIIMIIICNNHHRVTNNDIYDLGMIPSLLSTATRRHRRQRQWIDAECESVGNAFNAFDLFAEMGRTIHTEQFAVSNQNTDRSACRNIRMHTASVIIRCERSIDAPLSVVIE